VTGPAASPDRTSLLWLGVALAALLLFHRTPLWSLQFPPDADLAERTLPYAELVWSSFGQGEAPWFDPYQDAGTTLFSTDPYGGPFHPLFLLFAALPAGPAVIVILLLCVLAAGAGFFLLARSLSLARPSAALGAIVFGASSLLITGVRAGALASLLAVAHLPWLLWLLEIGRRQPRRACLLAGLVIGLALLGGRSAEVLLVLVTAGAYAGARTLTEPGPSTIRLRPLLVLLGGTGIGVLLSAVELLPLGQHLAGVTTTASLPFAPDRHIWQIGLLRQAQLDPGIPGVEYPGMVTAFLAVGGLVLIPVRRSVVGVLLVVLGWALFLVPEVLLHPTLGAVFPPLMATRDLASSLFAPAEAAGLALLAAYGADQLLVLRDRQPARLEIFPLALVLVGLVAAWRWNDSDVEGNALIYTTLVVAGLPLVVLVLLARHGLVGSRVFAALLVLLCAAELLARREQARLCSAAPSEHLGRVLEPGDLVTTLMHDSPPGRIARFEAGCPLIKRRVRTNAGLVHRLAVANLESGNPPPCLRDLVRRLRGMTLEESALRQGLPTDGQRVGRYEIVPLAAGSTNDRVLDLLDVKALVTDLEVEGEAFEKTFIFFPAFVWTNRSRPAPRRRITHARVIEDPSVRMDRLLDPDLDLDHEVLLARPPPGPLAAEPEGATIEVLTDRPGHRELRVPDSAGELLVLSTTHQPGWRAERNGAPVEILQANGCFQAVYLPPGDQHLVLVFRPPGLWTGAAISLLTLIGLIWGLRRCCRQGSTGRAEPDG